MNKEIDIIKRKKLMEEKLVMLLSKANLKPAELALIEEIEQKLSVINKKLG